MAYIVYKKWKPSEARVFENKKTSTAFMTRVKNSGGAKLVRKKI
jgi:hypothetical protein